MANFADLVINDGQATPVAHTFKARNITNGIAKWQDISGGIAIGYPLITAAVREPSKETQNYKVSLKVVVPVLETISGTSYAGIVAAPQKAYDCTCVMDFILPARSTTAVRKDVLAYVKNLLANAVPAAMVQDMDFVA